MNIRADSFVEHQCFGEEELQAPDAIKAQMAVPGGSTTCWGTSCTTTCVK